MDKHGVFTDPAKTSALCQFTFEDGTRVGVITIGDRMPELFFDELHDLLQAWRDDIMIIITQGIGCDLEFIILHSAFYICIRQSQNEDGLAFGEDQLRVGAA